MKIRAANVSGNDPYSQNMYRDLFLHSCGRIDLLPWNISLNWRGPGADWGCTSAKNWPGSGAAAGDPFPAEARVTHKRFGAQAGTPDMIVRDVTRSAVDFHKCYGSYMRWMGTPVNLSGTAGAGGYAEFVADDTWFAQYAFTKTSTDASGKVYRKLKVLQGTIQVFAMPDINTPPASNATPAFEVTAAQSDSEQAFQFTIGTGNPNLSVLWARRKPGVATRFAEVREYIKGAEATAMHFVPPQRTPQDITAAIDFFDPLAQWDTAVFGGAQDSISLARASGASAGTLFLKANTPTEPNRVLRYTGRNGQKAFPAGGVRFSAELPENGTFGTKAAYGIFNKQFVEEEFLIGSKGHRHLNSLGANGEELDMLRLPNFMPTGDALFAGKYLVRVAKQLQHDVIWVPYPDVADRASIKAHMKEMAQAAIDQNYQSFRFVPEFSNEIWNDKFAVFFNMQRYRVARGESDVFPIISDRIHELLDIWSEVVFETGTTIRLIANHSWQSGASSNFNAFMTRRAGGGSGPRLGDRFEAMSDTNWLWSTAWYFAGGQAGVVVGNSDEGDTVLNVVGNNGTVEQYRDETIRQLLDAASASASAARNERITLRQRVTSAGWSKGDLGQYEGANRHTSRYSDPANANLRQGTVLAEQSTEVAEAVGALFLTLAKLCVVTAYFQVSTGRVQPGKYYVDGYWPTHYWTGYGTTGTDGLDNETPVFSSLIDAYAADLTSTTPTPSPSPSPSPFVGIGMPFGRAACLTC